LRPGKLLRGGTGPAQPYHRVVSGVTEPVVPPKDLLLTRRTAPAPGVHARTASHTNPL